MAELSPRDRPGGRTSRQRSKSGEFVAFSGELNTRTSTVRWFSPPLAEPPLSAYQVILGGFPFALSAFPAKPGEFVAFSGELNTRTSTVGWFSPPLAESPLSAYQVILGGFPFALSAFPAKPGEFVAFSGELNTRTQNLNHGVGQG